MATALELCAATEGRPVATALELCAATEGRPVATALEMSAAMEGRPVAPALELRAATRVFRGDSTRAVRRATAVDSPKSARSDLCDRTSE